MTAIVPPGELLLKHYESKRLKNPKFSARAFARFLKVTPSYLSMLFKGKRTISSTLLRQFAKLLNLNDDDYLQLKTSNSFWKLKSNEERKNFLNETDGTLLKKIEYKCVDEKHFHLLKEPLHIEILNQIEVAKFRYDSKKMSQDLNVDEQKIKDCCNNLIEAGLVYRTKENIFATNLYQLFNSMPSRFIRNYHKHYMKKAIIAIDRQPIERRDFRSTTFSIDPDCLDDLKDEIQKFHQKILKLSQNQKKKKVYQLSVQLFQLGN